MVTVDAGICGFTTTIQAVSADKQTVQISFESGCPHVIKAKEELTAVDAFQELFDPDHPSFQNFGSNIVNFCWSQFPLRSLR